MTTSETLLARSIASHQAGDMTAAAKGYATLLEEDAQNADAWHLSGAVALQSGKPHEAIRYFRRALEIRDDQAEYYTNLAIALGQVGGLVESEQCTAEALRLAPQLPVAHFRRGKVLASLGRVDEALHHFQVALDLDYEPAMTLLEASVVYRSVGAMPQCISALEQSAQLAEDPVPAVCQLAALTSEGLYQLSEDQFQQLIEAVEAVTENPARAKRAARAAFALGRVLERHADYEQAFQLFVTGNRLSQRYLKQRSPSDWLARRKTYAERLRQRLTAERTEAMARFGNPSDRPIFVVGFPRSGTTLVSQILASHPQVGTAGELKIMSLMTNRMSHVWDDDAERLLVDQHESAQMAASYLSALAAHDADSPRVVDKMPGNALILGLIHAVFPQATLVWCRRDLRDIATSCYSIMFEDDRLQFETSELDWLAESLNLTETMRHHWHSVLPGQIYEVEYEQLTRHPEAEIRRLLAACSLDWEPECLRPESQRSAVRTASSVQVRQPIHQRSQQRWKRFEPWTGEALAALGQSENAIAKLATKGSDSSNNSNGE